MKVMGQRVSKMRPFSWVKKKEMKLCFVKKERNIPKTSNLVFITI